METTLCIHKRAQDPTLGPLPAGMSFYSRRWKKRTVKDTVQHMLQLRCLQCGELFLVVSDRVCKLPCGDKNCLKVHYQNGRADVVAAHTKPPAAVSPNGSSSSTGTPPPLDDSGSDTSPM